jgi:hypothetical protein
MLLPGSYKNRHLRKAGQSRIFITIECPGCDWKKTAPPAIAEGAYLIHLVRVHDLPEVANGTATKSER